MTLLRDGGVEVVVANSVADVEQAARPDTLILVAQSQYLTDDALLDRLAKAPGDLLLVEPTSRTREALTPGVRIKRRQRLRQRARIALCARLIEPDRCGSGQATPTRPRMAGQ